MEKALPPVPEFLTVTEAPQKWLKEVVPSTACEWLCQREPELPSMWGTWLTSLYIYQAPLR